MIQEPILIVDDEPEIRETLLEALASQGFSAEAASNAEEALARMEETFFPVVMTDLNMPGGLTGLDLIRTIQQRFPDTLCIIITAFATLDSSIEALKLGAYDLIQKPFRISEMVAVLNRALDHGALLRKLASYQEELETRILARTRELQETNQEALTIADLCMQGLEAPSLAQAIQPLLDFLVARWSPDGLACYRRDPGGDLRQVLTQGPRALPSRLERPQPGTLEHPPLGYPEAHLIPLGNTGWLYLGYEGRSSFVESDPSFLLLSRHLEILLRVR
ncbi:MAG TPA: response regulator [Geothrix sp.]|nr:response regulator [Geothrix sp.]